MGDRTTVRHATEALTTEERRAIRMRAGEVRWRAARALGVGELTYDELISPGGRVAPATVARVRAWLESGPVDETGRARDE